MAPSISVFRSLVLQDLDTLPNKRTYTDPKLKKGLKQLCERRNLIIRPADKGGAIIVLDKDAYIREMGRILDDSDTYSRIPGDPTSVYKRELSLIVNEGSSFGILDKKESSFLIPLASRIPAIYYLPKIHKDPVDPPGRLIVSGIDSVTSRIGRYIDYHLQPLVRLAPSYINDTSDTIRRLESVQYQEGMIPVTADISALYTCIPHDLGFAAVEYYLSQNATIPLLQRNFIMDLLRLFLVSKLFLFTD